MFLDTSNPYVEILSQRFGYDYMSSVDLMQYHLVKLALVTEQPNIIESFKKLLNCEPRYSAYLLSLKDENN